jgi:Flp pilus assembly pilin Flp
MTIIRKAKKVAKSSLEKCRVFIRSERGLSVTEYAVAASLVAASIALTFSTLGATVEAAIVALTTFL